MFDMVLKSWQGYQIQLVICMYYLFEKLRERERDFFCCPTASLPNSSEQRPEDSTGLPCPVTIPFGFPGVPEQGAEVRSRGRTHSEALPFACVRLLW